MQRKRAIILSQISESVGSELLLRSIGFETRNPKRPTLQSIIDAAPDLIVFNWDPSHEDKTQRL
jgi:hypothetical protein